MEVGGVKGVDNESVMVDGNMSAKPPYWIEQLAIKGYRLYHPCRLVREMTVDEML